MGKVKTKKIKTKKEKNMMKLDIIVFLVCCILTKSAIKGSIVKELFGFFGSYEGNILAFVNIAIAFFWMVALVFIGKCFVIIAVYLAYRISRMKVIKENSKYEVINNIEYYRERFNNITPAEISLITDLEIEMKKDISASILNLYQNGVIEFNENNIIIKNNDISLRRSEKKLIEMINNNSFNNTNMDEWKKISIEEAKNEGYIVDKKDKKKGPNFSLNNWLTNLFAIIFVVSIIYGCSYIVSPEAEEMNALLDEYEELYADEDLSDLEILENNPEAKELYIKTISKAGPLMIISVVITASFFALLGTPIYRKVKAKIYYKYEKDKRFERTEESKILVEQIVGVKNYIHEFSLLSEKEKEDIVLWDDFLIYAVVLEENDIIEKDIYKYKNINPNIISNIEKIISFS